MKRFLFLFSFLLFAFSCLAQETLSPLASNPYVKDGAKKNKGLRSQHDSAFLAIYPLDTLTLPFKDDFSRDRFKSYSLDTSASGVRDSIFYRLFTSSNQVLSDTIGSWPMDTVGWSQDTTFTVHYDTINGDTVVSAKTPLPSQEILVNDLWTKFHDTVRYRVWPALTVRDSVWTGTPDTMAADAYDLIQDSLDVFYFPSDSTRYWTDRQVFLNNTLSEDPPSIGFATFDGLDKEGYPYNFNDPYAYGEADALTSKPIDLSNYTPLDSVFLSFFYQRKGLGNAPESEDSLVLEYFRPDSNEWTQVWSKNGGSGTAPRQVLVPVQNPDYLKKGFRFRFRNYATLSGGFDHWHLDYVRLFPNRNSSDTAISDVAYTRLPDSFLETYTSVPWDHYQQDSSHIKDQYTTHHNNLDVNGRFVEFFSRAFFEGNQLWQYDQGVNANVLAGQRYTHDNLVGQSPSNFSFPTGITDTSATFEISMIQRTNPDTTASNDSITFEQDFRNYYAFDDGTAEVGYGISPSGINTPKIAQRFEPYIGDTIVGAYIHFAPAFEDVSKESFFLTIWKDDGGIPGSIKYQNISFSNPSYGDEQTEFVFYEFDDPVVFSSPAPYFIGVDQTTQVRINIGMDRNNDHSQRIYYNSSGTWENSGFNGSLMIRPVYASAINLTGVPEPPKDRLSVQVHPNPTRGKVWIRSDDQSYRLSVQAYDMQGRKVLEKKVAGRKIDLSDEEEGLYILRIKNLKSGRRTTRKVMIQR